MTKSQIQNVNLPTNQEENTSIYDKRLSIVIVLHLCILACKNMLVSTNDFFFSINSTLNNIILISFVFIYVWAVFKARFLQRINPRAYVIVLLLGIFIGVSCIADPELFISNIFPYDYVKSQARLFIAYCLPLFLAFSALKSTDYLLKILFKSTPIMFAFATFSFVLATFSFTTSNEYSMSYGYAALFLSVLLVFKYSTNRSFLTLIAFVFTTFYIVISGSRGAILCVAMAILVVLSIGKMTIGKIGWICVILLCSAFFIFGYDLILELIGDFLNATGLFSRTLSMMIDGNIAVDSGRSEYHQGIIDALSESPIIGLGAFGGEATVGLSHGTYIDIFANFGYVFGSVFLIFLVYQILKIVRREKYTSLGMLFCIFAVSFLVRGFFDGGFWYEKELWIIMGVIISYDKISCNKQL